MKNETSLKNIAMILPFAREQEVEARWFYFWSVEVVEGDD
jgi:hypothetical protein